MAPLILAVETSGRIGSVALAKGEELLDEIAFSAPLRHSAELFDSMNILLNRFKRKPADVAQIYISNGPGSFTGLRIAATFAKMMHLANKVKIVTVDSLDVIAANVDEYCRQQGHAEKTAVILDAKRGRFFVAVYENCSGSLQKKILPTCLMTTQQFKQQFDTGDKEIWLLGEGLVYYKDSFKTENLHILDESYWWPKAAMLHRLGWQMAQLGRFTDALALQPAYLQRPDIKMKSY